MLHQLLKALVVGFRVIAVGLVLLELSLGDRDVRLRLIDRRLVGSWFDLGADLTDLDERVVVAGQTDDSPRDVAADDDRQGWVDRPGRSRGAFDKASRRRRRHITQGRGPANAAPSADRCGQPQQGCRGNQPPPRRRLPFSVRFHGCRGLASVCVGGRHADIIPHRTHNPRPLGAVARPAATTPAS